MLWLSKQKVSSLSPSKSHMALNHTFFFAITEKYIHSTAKTSFLCDDKAMRCYNYSIVCEIRKALCTHKGANCSFIENIVVSRKSFGVVTSGWKFRICLFNLGSATRLWKIKCNYGSPGYMMS